MIGLIIVSHSKLLADGLHQLAAQMQNKQSVTSSPRQVLMMKLTLSAQMR
ncbi:hypothetical protein [Providencia stuartii]|nr:hypothetical protein [Providencia stuartii]